ncbi:MAG: Crp/Fnr family transcriptional regulator [Acidobacteria bacterium]|nr:Crp/Fnr family transcriptional regulator [Acidobacteriota bacterium]
MSASVSTHVPVGNYLLSALTSRDYENLVPHLEFISLDAGMVLYDCGESIRYVYFPLDSIFFLLAMMEDGATAEVGLVGGEGVIGLSVCMGAETMSSQAVVLNASGALRIKAEFLKREFERGSLLQALLLRYMQALFIQVSQTAACNRIHHIEVRLARWLLMVHDRVVSDDIPITQEFIAQMLGTPRPYVTVAAGILEKEGLIQCRRGHIRILNREDLESTACECYGTVREEFKRLLGAANCFNKYSPLRSEKH